MRLTHLAKVGVGDSLLHHYIIDFEVIVNIAHIMELHNSIYQLNADLAYLRKAETVFSQTWEDVMDGAAKAFHHYVVLPIIAPLLVNLDQF